MSNSLDPDQDQHSDGPNLIFKEIMLQQLDDKQQQSLRNWLTSQLVYAQQCTGHWAL